MAYQTPLNFGGAATRNFQQDGRLYGSNLGDMHANPKVTPTVDPLHAAIELLGAPPMTSPDVLDALPRNYETIAALYQGARPTPIENLIIRGTVGNMAIGHFRLLPPRNANGQINGMEVNILRLQNTLPDPQPEGTAPRFIAHSFEKVHMRHERYGIGMRLSHDFYMRPEGRQLYADQIAVMVQNVLILGQLTVTSAFLRAKDYYFRWRQRYTRPGTYGGSSAAMAAMDDQFCALHKEEKAWYKLMNEVKSMGNRVGTSFTHALVSSKVPELLAYGGNFETDYYTRGEESSKILTQGGDYFTKTPDGTQLVMEPEYTLMNVGQRGDETTKMLNQRVQLGRWFYIGRDPVLCNDPYAPPKSFYNLHYLNFDKGQGEITVQPYKELLNACLCWGPDGNLDEAVYSWLCEGNNAHSFAKEKLQIESLYPNGDTRDIPLIDPWIAQNSKGVPEIVRFLGNQDTRYASFDSQEDICRQVKAVVDKQMKSGDWKKIQAMLEMADRNYNVSPDDDGSIEAWFFAVVKANSVEDGLNRDAELVKDSNASVKLPWVVEGPDGTFYLATGPSLNSVVHRAYFSVDAAGVPTRYNNIVSDDLIRTPRAAGDFTDQNARLAKLFPGYAIGLNAINPNRAVVVRGSFPSSFPGFSTISNLRMMAQAYTSGDLHGWDKLPGYDEQFKIAYDGMLALDRYASINRKIWSTNNCRNAFFDSRNLPLFQKTGNEDIDSLTTFEQDLVQGIRYPVGFINWFQQVQPRTGGTVPVAENENLENIRSAIRIFSSNQVGNRANIGSEEAEPLQSDLAAGAFSASMHLNNPGVPGWDELIIKVIREAWRSGNLQELAKQFQTREGVLAWQRNFETSDASNPKYTGRVGPTARNWQTTGEALRDILQDKWSATPDVDIQGRGASLALIFYAINNVVKNYNNPTLPKDELPALSDEGLETFYRMTLKAKGKKQFLTETGEDVTGQREEVSARVDSDIELIGGLRSVPRVTNTFLSISPDYWAKVAYLASRATGQIDNNAGATLSFLRPSDPEAPLDNWLGLTPDFVDALSRFARGAAAKVPAFKTSSFSEEILKFARGRARFSLESTSMDPSTQPILAGSRFLNEPSTKRTRYFDDDVAYDATDDFSKHTYAGGKFMTIPPRGPGYEHENTFESWYKEDLASHTSSDTGVADGSRDAGTTFHAQRKGPHHLPFGQLQSARMDKFQQVPNQFWEFRWNHFKERYGTDFPILCQHFLYCGTRVNRDVFGNMAEEGILPPITLIPVDPFMDFETSTMVFVKAGEQTGFLSYDLQDLSIAYDGSHKLLYGFLTLWMGAMVKRIENVLVMPHAMFDGYHRGGDGSLVESVYSPGNSSGDPENYDFNPYNPNARRKHRFVLYSGVSTMLKDIPDPLPLTGSFISGGYSGLGSYIRNEDMSNALNGQAYQSALAVNRKVGFNLINREERALNEDAPFNERALHLERMNNLLCSQGNQFGMDKSSGSFKRRVTTGTGPLGKLCEGVGKVFRGSTALVSNLLKESGQG